MGMGVKLWCGLQAANSGRTVASLSVEIHSLADLFVSTMSLGEGMES